MSVIIRGVWHFLTPIVLAMAAVMAARLVTRLTHAAE